jgi:tripartite-type tricarboxylate transporter receptor subunit TctC
MCRCAMKWAISLITLLVPLCVAYGQQYPDRPIRLIVPFAPGGTTDILARILGQKLSENLGQQVVIDSRGGAGGNLGTALAAKASPNGYTLLLGVNSPFAINVSLYGSKLPFNPAQDFAPISLITKVPQVISAHPSVPARNLKELIALAKAHPDKLTYGTGGAGTTNHLVGELFNTAARIHITHVPYKGSGLASVAVFSGEVDMLISAPPTVINFVKAGRLRAVAVSSATRSPALPDVPTMMESGLPGFEATAWYCIVAPAGTPRAIIDKVRGALVKAMETPQVRQRLLDEGATPESSTPEELGEFIRAEIEKWAKAVRLSGARID